MEYTASQRIAYLLFEQMNLKLHYKWKYTERCACLGKDLVHIIFVQCEKLFVKNQTEP